MLHRPLAFALALVALGAPAMSPALSAEFKGQSKIDAVTVFPSGAEITRLARVRIEAGEHVVVLADLPAAAIPGSIRVEGKASGRLEIGSVDARRLSVPRSDPEQLATERRKLEREIERLRDERAVIDTQIQAAETQKALIQRLAELPVHPQPAGPGGAAPATDWNNIFALIGARMEEANRVIHQSRLKAREADRQIQDLERKLASLAPVQEARTEVRVNVSAGAGLDADLTIRYQVGQASWTPAYDARLTTGGKAAASKLTLVRRASIAQRTGEEWADVKLSLSTTRPGAGTAAPELFPMTVDFNPPPAPRPVAAAPPAQAPMGGVAAKRGMARADAAEGAAEEARQQDAVQQQAQVELGTFQAVFAVPGRTTVAAAGDAKRVQLETTDLEPSLVVRTTPRLQEAAFLYAKLTIPKGAPYLRGQVSLFRDGTFVGLGALPQLGSGEPHELGFGADDAVRVRFTVVKEERGESGLISASKTDERRFRIAVKSLHERPIQLVVMDQMPVPLNNEIRVEAIGKTQPSRQNVDDKRGVVAFDSRLEAGEERLIEHGWRIVWPAAKGIFYGR